MILSQLDSITPNLIGLALDGLTMRHQAIASNIANINTVGYQPMEVSFENQLSAIQSDNDRGLTRSSVDYFRPVITYGNKQTQTSNSHGIDMSTVQLNQNVIQYHSLIRGLEHYVSTLSYAVKEGRG